MHTQDEIVQPDQGSIALSDHRGPRVGRHMPTNSNAVKAAQLAQQLGCEAIQIFASNPTGWQPPVDDHLSLIVSPLCFNLFQMSGGAGLKDGRRRVSALAAIAHM